MTHFYTSVTDIGNYVYSRGYRNGKRFNTRESFMPTMFTRSDKDCGWKNISGQYCKPITFDSIRDCRDWLKRYSDVDQFEIYGNNRYSAQYIYQTFGQTIDFDRQQISVASMDIEVASDSGFPEPQAADHPVISIVVKLSTSDTYHTWGLLDYDSSKTELVDLNGTIRYYRCQSEQQLLQSFVAWWADENNTPDVLTGWYTKMFDVPYLVNRITKIIGPNSVNRLSPFGRVSERIITILNRDHQTYSIAGVQHLDYIELFRKFGYVYGAQESYKLDHIAHIVLGENKLSYEEYGNLNQLYKDNPQKFIDYNIRDVELIEKLEDRLGYISLAATIAYRAGCNLEDTMGTIVVWDNIIYRDLNSKNVCVNLNSKKIKTSYPGGFVKEPQIGLHNWICSFDLNSLYPSLIMQYNMSPETITGEIEHNFTIDNCLEQTVSHNSTDCVAANGVHFRKDKLGVVPAIIKEMYERRVGIKQQMLKTKQLYEQTKDKALLIKSSQLENEQMSIKILLNSLYGALGNPSFRYFDVRMASAITMTGQLTIRWAEKALNHYLNNLLKTNKDYVVAIDTDSVYIELDDLVKSIMPTETDKDKIVSFLDKVCEHKIEPVLADAYQRLADYLGVIENRMVMKREAIASRGIWTAKKRYVLNVHNNEGVQYTEPKLKVMGIEAVKSSTPEVCRDKMMLAFKIALEGTENDMQQFIKTFRDEFKTLPPESVAFPRSVSDVESKKDAVAVYQKGTPIHVRGSLVYNNMIKNAKLENVYPLIQSGEKIKFCYLNTPNPARENVIAFPQYLPRELQLNQYVDYDTQFDKSFVEPLKAVLDPIGWETEKTQTLMDFFS